MVKSTDPNGVGIGIDLAGGKLAPPVGVTSTSTSTSAATSAPTSSRPSGPHRQNSTNATTGTNADEVLDSETILANVEEMLEGFEWRGADAGWGAAGSSASGGKSRSKADEMERRLVSELKALEAVRFSVPL